MDFKFYPSKSAIVGAKSLEFSAVHIKIWNSNTGDEIYTDQLPVILPGGGRFVSQQFDIVHSAGQLVVLGRKRDIPVVVIFQLMAGVVGEPRVWVLDQMEGYRFSQCLAVDKTSVTVAERRVSDGQVQHLVMDFWN